jgi:hypothetical protein
MNHRTRIRLMQSGMALILILFVSILASLLLRGRRESAQEEPTVSDRLAEEALEAEAEQVSKGFEVTRTREGVVVLTVRAERLLGLRGDVYLLEHPTLEIHHEGEEPSAVRWMQRETRAFKRVMCAGAGRSCTTSRAARS